MAIVLAVQKWRHYLLGKHFLIHSDQQSLKFLMDQRLLPPEQLRCVTKLMGYDFEIQYKAGTVNKVADALSRRGMDEVVEAGAISVVQTLDLETLRADQEQDPILGVIMQHIRNSEEVREGYSMKNDLLFYKGRLVLPKPSKWITSLLHEFHDSLVGGHSGFFRTLKRMSGNVFWQGMKKDIRDYVAECEVCQKSKNDTLSLAGLLQPLPIPALIWEDISIDFVGGLPKSKGIDTILVVVDRLSKYAHFCPLVHPFTAKQVAELFAREIVRLHGFPRSIVSDRDPIFMSGFWKELFKLQGSKLHHSSTYHPQSDGQTEVVNRCLESYLRCFASDKPKSWSGWLPWAEYWFNTTYNASTQMTTFKIVYGRDPPTLIRFQEDISVVEDVNVQLRLRNQCLDLLKENLEKSQNRMKQYADSHRRELQFQQGDQVWLKLRPYRLRSLARKMNEKLSPHFYGPFEVSEKIDQVAYRLKLPDTAKIHNVFHVSLLKPFRGKEYKGQPLPHQLSEDMELLVTPEDILQVRNVTHGLKAEVELLVKWKDLPSWEATWEPLSLIQAQFADFNLEGKVGLQGGSNDKPPIHFVYSRRGKYGN
ncbi:hypothetical protein UlMin_038123 [Ulmus minor]